MASSTIARQRLSDLMAVTLTANCQLAIVCNHFRDSQNMIRRTEDGQKLLRHLCVKHLSRQLHQYEVTVK